MLSSKQQEYLNNCDHRWNIKIGATGSGKSWLDYAYVIPKRLTSLKGQGAVVMLGNTQGTLKRNILEPMRELHGNTLVTEVNNQNFCWIYGKKVYVLGADSKKHIDRIRGMTIEYAYGDEMTTWNEGVFQMLKSRLRCEHSFFDGTGNPEAPTNYLKAFLDSNADIFCQKSTIFDNPFLPKQFVEDLCNEYEGTVYYKRYILGEWSMAEGLIYPLYENAMKKIKLEGKVEQIVLSADYGTQNAFAVLLWAKKDDVWYAAREYYYSGRDEGSQKTDAEYADDLVKFTMDFVNDEMEDGAPIFPIKLIIDPSAASFITLMKKNRMFKVIPAENAVADGIRETATAMHTGLVKFSPTLYNWVKEISGYVWDERKGQDVPIKENDHLMDAMRYFVKTMRITRPKTQYTPLWNY